MMNAIRLHKILDRDGELLLKSLPYRKGQAVELIVLSDDLDKMRTSRLTAAKLLDSGLVGLWQDRPDIGDSAAYARQLREQAQQRMR